MDLQQATEAKWAKDISDFEKHMESIRKSGGLGVDIKYDRIGNEYKCTSCGAELAPGVFRCEGIKFDGLGVKEVCPRCQAGIGHAAFKCRRCLRLYKSEDVIGNKKHFFMNLKTKVRA